MTTTNHTTLAQLEALPELGRSPDLCMCCHTASIRSGASEVIVYRAPDGANLTFGEARQRRDVDEVTTAHICHDCNDRLYA